MEDNEIAVIEIKFQRSGLLCGVTLKSVYAVSWDAYFKIIYKSKPVLANDTDPATTLLPKFGKIERISQFLGFVYFGLNLIQKFLVNKFNLVKYRKVLITAWQLFPMIIFSIVMCISRKQLGIMSLLFF